MNADDAPPVERSDVAMQQYDDPRQPGTPDGISPYGVALRSRIADTLSRAAFPGSREELLAHAEAATPVDDAVLTALRRLPSGRYDRLQEVADALGLGLEQRN